MHVLVCWLKVVRTRSRDSLTDWTGRPLPPSPETNEGEGEEDAEEENHILLPEKENKNRGRRGIYFVVRHRQADGQRRKKNILHDNRHLVNGQENYGKT